jgi:hypothetical protein
MPGPKNHKAHFESTASGGGWPCGTAPRDEPSPDPAPTL